MKALGYISVILVAGLLGFALYPSIYPTLVQAGWVEDYRGEKPPADLAMAENEVQKAPDSGTVAGEPAPAESKPVPAPPPPVAKPEPKPAPKPEPPPVAAQPEAKKPEPTPAPEPPPPPAPAPKPEPKPAPPVAGGQPAGQPAPPAAAPPQPEPPKPEPPKQPASNTAEIVSIMKASIRSGQIKEFTYDQVIGWKGVGEEEIDGETYRTGLIAYKAKTIFGVNTIQAKALIQDGKVVKWIWPKSGMEIK